MPSGARRAGPSTGPPHTPCSIRGWGVVSVVSDMGRAVAAPHDSGARKRNGWPDERARRGRGRGATGPPRARAARGETFSLEFTLPAADGTRRWYEANGQPLGDPAAGGEGGAGHAVVVIRDITLSSQHRRLQDEFLALASHELRTPLTAIQGYLDLLQPLLHRSGADEHLALYATKAQHHVRRLVALVGDLVD